LGRAAQAPFTGPDALGYPGRSYRHFLLPALNGAIGDQLEARGDHRAIRLSFRRHGADVPAADLNLAGEAPRRTVVWLHGLMGDEHIWQTGSGDMPRFGPRLEQEAGVRNLYVRYNSGRHISLNGRELSQLLTELVSAWPDAIQDLVLVGHSMGGLVIRSAGYYGEQAQAPWLAKLRHVFLLGVPNEGSFLEQNSFLTALMLRRFDLRLARLVANTIDRRSSGIRDLRHARLVDEDWQSPHADDLLPPRTEVPPLPGVTYHVLAASLLKNAQSIISQYFGDGLVGSSSATGSVFRSTLTGRSQILIEVFPRQHHGTLLANPEVYEYLRKQL
jgi:pimeloyl-ACP methyl ester carboxylesterase